MKTTAYKQKTTIIVDGDNEASTKGSGKPKNSARREPKGNKFDRSTIDLTAMQASVRDRYGDNYEHSQAYQAWLHWGGW